MNYDEPTVVAGSGGLDPTEIRSRAASRLAGTAEVLGELGRGPAGAVALLGRSLRDGTLVAIRAQPHPGQVDGLDVQIMYRLDEALPELRGTCPGCANRLSTWSRFCPYCAIDLVGIAVSHSGRSRAELLALVRQACEGRYELIGEFRGRGEGSLQYFGRDPETGRILAMQLTETVVAGDRRSGKDRRRGGDGSHSDRRVRNVPVPVDRRQSGKPRYSLDLTEFDNPLNTSRDS